jgi:hypothetical protein
LASEHVGFRLKEVALIVGVHIPTRNQVQHCTLSLIE